MDIIVVDTGFGLSVAAVNGLPPVLGHRWKGRTRWPKDVQSELQYRDQRPGGGIPAGLARQTLNSAGLWLPNPTELTDEQRDEAETIREQLAGTDSTKHAGEAAGVVLARATGGIIATEDFAAADVIRTTFGIRTTSITVVLHALHRDNVWTQQQVDAALADLRTKGRPNVDGLTAADIIGGRFRP